MKPDTNPWVFLFPELHEDLKIWEAIVTSEVEGRQNSQNLPGHPPDLFGHHLRKEER